MILTLNDLGKKFNRDWVIKDLNYTFNGPGLYAVRGPNGSGKSTLLKLIAGYILPSKGEVEIEIGSAKIPVDEVYKYLGVTAPYMQLIEELTLDEFLNFHMKFRNMKPGESRATFRQKTGLSRQGNKYLKDFSSGMKQRVKLGLCFYFQNDILLIDEGSSNLDSGGVEWFREEVRNLKEELVILFSNQEAEYSLCENHLQLSL